MILMNLRLSLLRMHITFRSYYCIIVALTWNCLWLFLSCQPYHVRKKTNSSYLHSHVKRFANILLAETIQKSIIVYPIHTSSPNLFINFRTTHCEYNDAKKNLSLIHGLNWPSVANFPLHFVFGISGAQRNNLWHMIVALESGPELERAVNSDLDEL